MGRKTITAEPDEQPIVIMRVFDAPRETWKRLVEVQEMESEGEEDR